jgi:hypothetical protein
MVFERTRAFPATAGRCPLIEPAMRRGRRLFPSKPIREVQRYAKNQLEMLAREMQRLVNPEIYWVGLSQAIAENKRSALHEFWAESIKNKE